MKHLERALYGQNQIWRYIALFLIAFFGGQMIGGIPLVVVMLGKAFVAGDMSRITSGNFMDFSAYGISNNLALTLILLTFTAIFFTFALLVKPLHGRTLKETINGRKHIRWNRVWMGIIVWGILLIASLVVSLLISSPEDYEFRFNPSALIGLVLVVLILMPFQTSIEEILFRGYLAQGVGKWTRSRWWALIIPSVLFALMHSANPEVKEFGFWLMMPNYLLMGLLLGIISILDDGIELALGVHFINNALGSILFTFESSVLQTDALFMQHNIDPIRSLLEMAVLTVLALYIFKRIYKWDFGIINKKIIPELPPVPPLQNESTEPIQHV